MNRELPVTIACQGDCLPGILHVPTHPGSRGVLVVVGGPQYRVGSHRQFVLLARDLAAAGVPVMRFDYRGMGDSEGESGTPEPCEHLTDDLHAAIDAFFNNVPTLKEVILWGLCDGASAALLYAHGDARVSGVALINPWVSTQGTPAKTYLKHYYARRVLQGDFWRKLLRGEADVFASLSSFGRILAGGAGAAQKSHTAAAETPSVSSFQDRMADGLSKFSGRVLLVLSGNDLIAAEFKDMISASKRWNKLLRSPRVTRHDFAQADHTFSCRAWRDQVAAWTRDWIRSWP